MDNTPQLGLQIHLLREGYHVRIVPMSQSGEILDGDMPWAKIWFNDLRAILVGHLGYSHAEADALLRGLNRDQIIATASSPNRTGQHLEIRMTEEEEYMLYRILGDNSQPRDVPWLRCSQLHLPDILVAQFGFQSEPAASAMIQAMAQIPNLRVNIYPIKAATI